MTNVASPPAREAPVAATRDGPSSACNGVPKSLAHGWDKDWAAQPKVIDTTQVVTYRSSLAGARRVIPRHAQLHHLPSDSGRK
jgi:hypothetical protein